MSHIPLIRRDGMRHEREWWLRHVEAWRSSGLTQSEYCRRHGVGKGSLARWSSKLKAEGNESKELIEIPRRRERSARTGGPAPPIELVVESRYLMRLWRGIDRDHLREVLSVLEERR